MTPESHGCCLRYTGWLENNYLYSELFVAWRNNPKETKFGALTIIEAGRKMEQKYNCNNLQKMVILALSVQIVGYNHQKNQDYQRKMKPIFRWMELTISRTIKYGLWSYQMLIPCILSKPLCGVALFQVSFLVFSFLGLMAISPCKVFGIAKIYLRILQTYVVPELHLRQCLSERLFMQDGCLPILDKRYNCSYVRFSLVIE